MIEKFTFFFCDRTFETDFEIEDLEKLERLMSELEQVQKMQYKIHGDTQQVDCELRQIDKEEKAMRLRKVEGQTMKILGK